MKPWPTMTTSPPTVADASAPPTISTPSVIRLGRPISIGLAKAGADVVVDDLDGCPRYIGRVFRGVRVGPSPQWLRSRLYLAEMRSISNVVDVTNYVMLEIGKPTHAFDRAAVGERVEIRAARSGEPLETLDHVMRTLEDQDLVVADERAGRPLSAGRCSAHRCYY